MADSTEHSSVDHSKIAIEHAQHVANFLVDEARLSANMFEWTNDEQKMLLNNFNVMSVSLPTQNFSPHPQEEDLYSMQDFYRTEMYLFWITSK